MTYIVQSGDSLWSIAARFGVSAQAIATANQISNAQMLFVGQTLVIPTAGSPASSGMVPSAPSQGNGTMGERLDKLERDFNQFVTIVGNHRRQIAELDKRVKRLER